MSDTETKSPINKDHKFNEMLHAVLLLLEGASEVDKARIGRALMALHQYERFRNPGLEMKSTN